MVVMTENKLLTLKEVAGTLRVSPKTVKRFIISGRLEGILVGAHYRVKQEALDRYLAEGTVQPEEDKK